MQNSILSDAMDGAVDLMLSEKTLEHLTGLQSQMNMGLKTAPELEFYVDEDGNPAKGTRDEIYHFLRAWPCPAEGEELIAAQVLIGKFLYAWLRTPEGLREIYASHRQAEENDKEGK
jgi:hypothetical protein